MLGRLFGFNKIPDQKPTDQLEQSSCAPPPESHPSEQFTSLEGSAEHPKGGSSFTSVSLASASSSLFVTDIKSDGALNQAIMYTVCDADIRSTTEPHHFELIITRTDDDDADGVTYPPQVAFPIDNSAVFESSDNGLGWSDDHGRRYHLDFDDENTARDFCATLARSLFETIHSRSPGPSDIENVRELLTKPEPAKPSDLLAAAGELIRVSGELFKYDVEVEKFDLLAPKIILTINSAVVKEDNTRGYLMSVYSQDDGKKLMETELSNSMTGQFFTETLSVVWILNLDPDAEPDFEEGKLDPEKQVCLSVKIPNPVAFVRFREQYAVCLYEVNHQASMDDLKLKDEDRDYIANVERDDVDPMEIDDDDATDAEDERHVRDELPSGRASIADVDDGMVNSQLAVSANTDRSFVIRGNKMGVFRTGTDGAAFTTAIDFTDPSKGGKRFMPSNILLHEGDTSMLVLDSQDDSTLMRMDLERGEIVDTWSGPVMKHNTVNNIHRASKYANLTGTKEFVGLNKNALMRMDPRTREFVVQSKRYAASTRAKLDCMATTGAGHLAVASENGDIRLYDQIGKNAKTHLPGLGDRIIGIDVSEDGNYILATTAKYLLVINSMVKGDKTYSGFAKSMGKNKPTPRKLVIKPEDIVKHRMGEICFTPAHFNTGRSSLEKSIVTSTGPFLVTWNFRAVKLGRLNSYNITRFRDNIVADDFAFGDEGRIVMSLPNDVSVVTRR